MNLLDQLGALELSLDEILHAGAVPASSPSNASVPPSADVSASDDETKAPTLSVSRPEKNVIQMDIGGKTVTLNPEGVSRLIEELSNARASMEVEQPMGLPPGWRYVATKDPIMASQRYPNGDRLLVMRHTGHGWVPFSFSPKVVLEMYALLTQR
jgi:hypothetical protein